MKTNNHFPKIFGTLLVSLIVILSCSTSKKAALACPEISVNKNYKAADHRKIKKETLTSQNRVSSKRYYNKVSNKNIFIPVKIEKDDAKVLVTESIFNLNKTEYSENLLASTDNAIIPLGKKRTTIPELKRMDNTFQTPNLIIYESSGCDTIVLKSGSLLIGKVEEIGINEIKYKKCDNLDGPTIVILRSDVSVIFYSNGKHDFFPSTAQSVSSNNVAPNTDNNVPATEPLGIAGFIASIVGFFIAGVPLGIIAVIFGIFSYTKIKKNPNKYKGKGIAIASILIGFAVIILTLALVAA